MDKNKRKTIKSNKKMKKVKNNWNKRSIKLKKKKITLSHLEKMRKFKKKKKNFKMELKVSSLSMNVRIIRALKSIITGHKSRNLPLNHINKFLTFNQRWFIKKRLKVKYPNINMKCKKSKKLFLKKCDP